MSLVDRVTAAHGIDRWLEADAVRLHVSSGGLAFRSKLQTRALHDLTATVATTSQRVELETPTWTRRFTSGIPRPHGLAWSTCDIAAFAATALWTYVVLPFLLPDFDVEEDDDRLIVRIPPQFRTHCQKQILHIDDRGLIRRHDYTARDFGRWAHASQDVGDYREFDGLMIATRRRVRPSLWPHRPLLVWIDVRSAAVV